MKFPFLFCYTCILLLFTAIDVKCIYGGEKAQQGQFPYQVSLVKFDIKNWHMKKSCSGVILSDSCILTTVICTEVLEQLRHGVLGSVHIGTLQRTQGTGIEITEIVKHPNYYQDQFNYNIALLRTYKNIKFKSSIQPARLPVSDLSEGTKAYVSGWGETESTEDGSTEYLHYLQTQTITKDICQKEMPVELNYKLSDNHVCAKNKENIGLCTGDEGAPLVDENQYVIVIASFVNDRCGKDPDIYINVYQFNDWIESEMNTGHTDHHCVIPALLVLETIVLVINFN